MANYISGITLGGTNSVGATGNETIPYVELSFDGRYAVFHANLDPITFSASYNGPSHTFLKDLSTGQLSRVDPIIAANGFDDIGHTYFHPALSEDGRYIVYHSAADDRLYLRDMLAPTPVAITSVATYGVDDGLALSATGRYVAFQSDSTDLVGSDLNNATDIFLKDTAGGLTRVSTSSTGTEANDYSFDPSLTADGRYVVFWSQATNLVTMSGSPSPGSRVEIYIKDTLTGEITSPTAADPYSTQHPVITPDGKYIVFDGTDHLSPQDSASTNFNADVYVLNRATGAFTLVSTGPNGIGDADSDYPDISDDGRYVVFQSEASNFVPNDTNGIDTDIFVKDLQTGDIARVNVSPAGAQADSFSFYPTISGDGHYITFESTASNLLSTTNVQNVYITINPLWVQPVINGSGDPENLLGTVGDDVIFGNGGNDSILGGDGADSLIGGEGNDTVQGNAGSDFVRGALGNDEVRGGKGDDTVQGGQGLDVARGALGNDELRGGLEADQMFGGQNNDTLFGGQGNDTLQGLAHDDVLQGLAGNDVLTGGPGMDQFWFNNAGAANADTITDFDVGGEADTIVLQQVLVTVLSPGALAAGNFVSGAGASAADGDDYILYDTATGNLSYDADGSGGGAASPIATLSGAPPLTAADFLIVA
jgi:Ca2+-binding RTX toxin-like protein